MIIVRCSYICHGYQVFFTVISQIMNDIVIIVIIVIIAIIVNIVTIVIIAIIVIILPQCTIFIFTESLL